MANAQNAEPGVDKSTNKGKDLTVRQKDDGSTANAKSAKKKKLNH